MPRKKIKLPSPGYIKATKAVVTILAEEKVGGVSTYRVRFEDGLVTNWATDKVVVVRQS